VRGILADVTTAKGTDALVKAVGQVDILVNNLGVYESKAFADITDSDWQAMFDTNVMSGVRLARAYFPGMLERNQGRVIFVSSETALSVAKDMIHYAMTKTAQVTIARGMAELTKGTAVTVNSVLPGPTRSEGIIDFLKSVSSNPDATTEEAEAEFFVKGRPTSLLQRMIEAEEVANLVTYLASPRSSATNGAAIRVEGGLITTIA
jgi:NAD(P)-dependent dehydrogenase (short-subunit alcohol dehydrogenase family)